MTISDQNRIWLGLKKQYNDLKEHYTPKEVGLILDCKIIKAGFLIMETAITKEEKFEEWICARKYNLMAILYAYSSLAQRKKLKKAEDLTRDEKIGLKEETTKWPNHHGYDLGQMMKIVYAASFIAGEIFNCRETKVEFRIDQ